MEDEEDAEDRGRADERPRDRFRDVLLERHEHDDGHGDRERRKHQAVRDPVVLEIDRRHRDEEGTEEQIGDRDQGSWKWIDIVTNMAAVTSSTTSSRRCGRSWHARQGFTAPRIGIHPVPPRALPAPRARRRQAQRQAVLGNLDRDPLDEHVQDRADDEARKRADDGSDHWKRLSTRLRRGRDGPGAGDVQRLTDERNRRSRSRSSGSSSDPSPSRARRRARPRLRLCGRSDRPGGLRSQVRQLGHRLLVGRRLYCGSY